MYELRKAAQPIFNAVLPLLVRYISLNTCGNEMYARANQFHIAVTTLRQVHTMKQFLKCYYRQAKLFQYNLHVLDL
jgi:hypothetical protein